MENNMTSLYPRFSILGSLKARFKLGQENSRSGFFEDHIHSHADGNFFNRTSDDVAADPGAFFEIDPGRYVGDILCKPSQGPADHLADHGEGKELPAAADRDPLKLLAAAFDAGGAGAPDPGLAVATVLHD